MSERKGACVEGQRERERTARPHAALQKDTATETPPLSLSASLPLSLPV